LISNRFAVKYNGLLANFFYDSLPLGKTLSQQPLAKLMQGLVHQVGGWYSGAAAYFGWMREAKRENTRCGLRPMSDKAAGQKTRSSEGCVENGPAATLLVG
jgi:hypothetical protein